MKDPTVQTATMEDELQKAFQSIEADFESEKQELKLQIDCRMNDTMAKMKARFRSLMFDIASKVKLSDVSEMDGKLIKQEMNTVEVPIIAESSAVNGFAVNGLNGSNSNESNSNESNINESNGHLNSHESISKPSTSNGLSNGSNNYITETLSPLDFEDAQDLLNGEDYESDTSSVIFEDEIPIDRNASMMASIFKTSDQLVAEELLRQSSSSSNSNRVEELRKLDLVIANGPSPNTKQLMLNGTNVRMQVVSSVEVVSPSSASTSSKSSKQEQQASRSSGKSSKSFDASPIRRSDRIERKRLIDNTFNDDSMDFYSDYVDNSNWAIDEDSNISSGFDSMKRMSFGPSTTSSSASGKTTATQFLIELTPQHEVPKTIDLPPDFLRRHNVKGKDPMYPQKNGGGSGGNSNMPRNGTHQRSLPARWKDISTQCYSRTVYMSCPYPGCIAKLSKRDDYDMHMVRHNVKAYRCTIAGCGESFIKHPELGAHFRAAHGQLAEWPCDLCEKVYKGYPRLITHLRYEHEFGLFQCVSPACEYTAKNRKAICDHYVQLHREVNRQYICDYPNCARQCVSNTQLIYHQYHHLTIKPYKCLWEHCDQECTRSDAIYRHLEIQHLKLPHPGTMAERKELDKWIEVRHDQILKEPIRFVEVPGLYGNAL